MKSALHLRNAVRDALQQLKRGLRAANRQRLHRRRMNKGADYAAWIAAYDTPTAADHAAWQQWLAQLADPPTVSLLLILRTHSDVTQAERTVASLQAQHYPHWQLLIASTGAALPPAALADARVQRVSMTADLMANARGEWLALPQPGDQWPQHALLRFMQEAHRLPGAKVIYSDEDSIDRQGVRCDHHFKPDWNHDLQLSAGYIGHACIFLTAHWRACASDLALSGDGPAYAAVLRCTDGLSALEVAHVPQVLWHRSHGHDRVETPRSVEVLQAHLDRTSPGATASRTAHGDLRASYPVPTPAPRVSIVICTRNQYKLLHTCIESVVSKTTYGAYEILIVDNGSDDPRILEYLQQLPQQRSNVRVIRDDSPFNYSALNNMAVGHASGELIALLNNDIEVIDGAWLTEMVGHALRPEVGCVGAKLLYPDDTVQHAGVLVGGGSQAPGAVAAHYLRGIPRDALGYAHRAVVTQNLTAVTAACLVVRTATFHEAGGLDSANLSVAFNDVDFCLRVRELGLHNVWTPHALLYHHESASRGRGRFVPEVAYMHGRWRDAMAGDPCYNPNLSYEPPNYLLVRPIEAAPVDAPA